MSKTTVHGILRLDVPSNFNMPTASASIDNVRQRLDYLFAIDSDPIQWFNFDPRTNAQHVADLVAAARATLEQRRQVASTGTCQHCGNAETNHRHGCFIGMTEAALKPFEEEKNSD